MKKPQPKREVAIRRSIPEYRWIFFHASADAVEDFREFGRYLDNPNNPDEYWLKVDSRYDFDEVLAYIEQYGQESGGEG